MPVGMARLAIMTQADELCIRKPQALLGNLMARVASHIRVLAFERERRARGVEGNQPTADPPLLRVTPITGFLELPAMGVSVAGLADIKQADLHLAIHRQAGMAFLEERRQSRLLQKSGQSEPCTVPR